jgi:uncharacterized membrane protein YoaT (DUF817 family)
MYGYVVAMRKAPMPVNVATVILYLYVFLGALIGLFALMAAARARTDASEDRQLVAFAVVSLAVAAVIAALAHHLVGGRRWALITVLVLLWANAVQAIVRDATGFLNVGAALLITLLLLVPRSSRAHFAGRPEAEGSAPATS